MIAKRVDKTDNIGEDFTRLGEYIAAAREVGEKLDQLWIGNCAAGDGKEDLEAALAEVEAVRQLKGGSGNRTYHLIVSFREGEREKLTPDDLKVIAKSYADALGFGEHQYVAGTHINTDNFHMHIAFNKIHPETGKIHTPFRDYKTLEITSRTMEKQYELTVDRGMSDREELQGELSPAARDYESETWEVSFQRWVLEQKEPIMAVLQGAGSWQEVHAGLADYGVRLQQRGAGLVFRDRALKHSMKASALDRAAGAKRLSERLGPFEPSDQPRPEGASGDEQPDAKEGAVWITDHKRAIETALTRSATWEELHAQLDRVGIGLKKEDAELVFYERRGEGGEAVEASQIDEKIAPPKLEDRFGAFAAAPEAPDLADEQKPGAGVFRSPVYRPRPLMAMPAGAKSLWTRYLGKKRIVPTTRGIIARNWRTFLQTEAATDPLAFVMVVAQRELLEELLRTLGGDYGRGGGYRGGVRFESNKEWTEPSLYLDSGYAKHGTKPGEVEDESDDKKKSFFIELLSPRGTRYRVWGVDFERALSKSAVQKMDPITFEYDGSKKVKVRNKDGEFEDKLRHQWKIHKVPEGQLIKRAALKPDDDQIRIVDDLDADWNKASTVLDYGMAPYSGAAGEKGATKKPRETFFIKMKSVKGRVFMMWGADLERALKESGAELGDKVAMERLGAETEKHPRTGQEIKKTRWKIHKVEKGKLLVKSALQPDEKKPAISDAPIDLDADWKSASVLRSYGKAPYSNPAEETEAAGKEGTTKKPRESFFIEMESASGRMFKVWGVDFETALEASGAEIGDKIEIEHQGTKTVTLPDTGEEVERNSWKVHKVEKGKLIERVPSTPSRNEPLAAGVDESAKGPTAAALVRFIEHGHAPFKNDPSNPKSYYVTVEKPGGQPHTIWGVDLERAMGEANPAPGALVRIERTGATKVPGRNGETFERNTWAVRPETGPELHRARSPHSERDLER